MIDGLSIFYKTLCNIYGEYIVGKITTKSSENLDLLKDKEKINRILKGYNRVDDTSKICDECSDEGIIRDWINRRNLKKNTSISVDKIKKIMDLPSWKPGYPLEFKENVPSKDIMLIGMDPGPVVATDINLSYELGRFEITNKGVVNVPTKESPKIHEQAANNQLWRILYELFNQENFEFVKQNIFIVDVCRCIFMFKEDGKKIKVDTNRIISKCAKKYLLQQIELINPKVIIIQGGEPCNQIKTILGNMVKEEKDFMIKYKDELEQFGKNKNFPKIGWIYFDGSEPIRFIKIFHSSIRHQRMGLYNFNKKPLDPRFLFYKKLFKKYIFPYLGMI